MPGEDFLWNEVLRMGPMGLSKLDVQRLSGEMKPGPATILHRLFDQIEHQSKWVVERTQAMRDEAERIALIGQTMKRAGLRSYTDEHGRIFVAGDT